MIKLEIAPDRIAFIEGIAQTELSNRLINEQAGIEMGIYKVMYGFRVRAGKITEDFVEWDWCCVDSKILLLTTYSLVKMFLEHEVKFHELPSRSYFKPWNSDDWFIDKLNAKALELGMPSVRDALIMSGLIDEERNKFNAKQFAEQNGK